MEKSRKKLNRIAETVSASYVACRNNVLLWRITEGHRNENK